MIQSLFAKPDVGKYGLSGCTVPKRYKAIAYVVITVVVDVFCIKPMLVNLSLAIYAPDLQNANETSHWTIETHRMYKLNVSKISQNWKTSKSVPD